ALDSSSIFVVEHDRLFRVELVRVDPAGQHLRLRVVVVVVVARHGRPPSFRFTRATVPASGECSRDGRHGRRSSRVATTPALDACYRRDSVSAYCAVLFTVRLSEPKRAPTNDAAPEAFCGLVLCRQVRLNSRSDSKRVASKTTELLETRMTTPFPKTPTFMTIDEPFRLEFDLFDLEVEGEIPAELNGTFYRVGPDQQYPPKMGDANPFNGDGAVTAFR